MKLKKRVTQALALGAPLLCLLAGSTEQCTAQRLLCRNGLHIQMSDAGWGKGLPVVTSVAPYSPAQRAGIRVGDVIHSVDEVQTSGLTLSQVKELLLKDADQQILGISALTEVNRSKVVEKECKLPNSLTERELAELFALYSIEDVNSQSITYPFTYIYKDDPHLSGAKTYRIATSSNESTRQIDERLNRVIDEMMTAKGLVKTDHQADLVVSTYYQLSPTKQYRSDAEPESIPFSWRYDPAHQDLKPLPVVPADHPSGVYQLNLGISISSARGKQPIWSCEANETLSQAMTIEAYGSYAIPVMLHDFPWVSREKDPSWLFQTLRYNYTGIVYNKYDLSRIVDVESGSPAMRSGILPGDIVKSINGIAIDNPRVEQMLASYFNFVSKSNKYRESAHNALSITANGQVSRFWATDAYDAVANLLTKDKTDGAFAYLFAFRPYVNPEGLGELVFQIERRGETYFVPVRAERRNESAILPQL